MLSMDFINEIINKSKERTLVKIETMVFMVLGKNYDETVENNFKNIWRWFVATSVGKVVVGS
jgi:hypothetical protein